MSHIKALTWDHPRGFGPLDAAVARLREQGVDLTIEWDRQSLEGFESRRVEELVAKYDLIVLDHPHLGDPKARDALMPLESLFDEADLEEVSRGAIGRSYESYLLDDLHWALPLDAACQVMAYRPDLLDDDAPDTWDDVGRLAQERGKVSLSLAGPHAALTFMSIAAAEGIAFASTPYRFMENAAVDRVLKIMRPIYEATPRLVRSMNPITMLGYMAMHDEVALCPLIFGYVNYAVPESGRALGFANAPMGSAGRRGSILGGTGIGISRRCHISAALKQHLLWLVGQEVQTSLIPQHGGQPSLRAAWLDDDVNARWGDFFRNTAATLEDAVIRPNFAGAIDFQTEASAILRQGLDRGDNSTDIAERLDHVYRNTRRGPAMEIVA